MPQLVPTAERVVQTQGERTDTLENASSNQTQRQISTPGAVTTTQIEDPSSEVSITSASTGTTTTQEASAARLQTENKGVAVQRSLAAAHVVHRL
jgi:hypothetical protein